MGSVSTPALPGGNMEIVFSFDTTGSMSSCLDQVRAQVSDVVGRLFGDIPNLRIAIIAHGDYCDSHTYVTKVIDFCDGPGKLEKFVQKVGSTGGGDWEECYELVLRQTREQLSWTPGTQRALVMIGDAIPHEADYDMNKDNIDWKTEVQRLHKETGLRIYGVQCLTNDRATHFYKHLADETGGSHLQLGDFSSIVDMVMAICYREHDPEFYQAYEREVRLRDGAHLNPDLHLMFGALGAGTADAVTPMSVPRKAAPKKLAGAGRKMISPKKHGGVAKKVVTPKAGGATKKVATPKKRPAAAVVEVTPKRRRSSDSEGSSTSNRRKSTVKRVTTRASRHQMTLRPRPASVALYKKQRQIKRLSTSSKSSAPARRFREKVSGAKFILRKAMDWSSWKGLYADDPSVFTKKDMETPSVYEIAVQVPAGHIRYPVLCRATEGFHHSPNIYTNLLGSGSASPALHTHANKISNRGCRLFVRRAPWTGHVTTNGDSGSNVTSLDELRSLLTKTYDYAWRRRYNRESRKYLFRPVTKECMSISDNKRR